MTLIIAIKGSNGITIAADSRETYSDSLISDYAHKLVEVASNCCIGVSGNGHYAKERIDAITDKLSLDKKKPVKASRVAGALKNEMESHLQSVRSDLGWGSVLLRPYFLVVGWRMQHDDDVDYDGCIYLVEPEQECKSLYKNEPQGVFSKIGIWQDLLLIQRNLPSQGGFLNVPVSKLDRVAIWYLSQFASVLPSVAAPFAIKHVFRDRIEAVEAKEAEEVADGVAEAFRKCVKDLLG